MAHFYGMIKGNRGNVTRCGTKQSGLRTIANGWNIGVDVQLIHNNAGEDVVDIVLTGGSNGGHHRVLLGQLTRKDLEAKMAEL